MRKVHEQFEPQVRQTGQESRLWRWSDPSSRPSGDLKGTSFPPVSISVKWEQLLPQFRRTSDGCQDQSQCSIQRCLKGGGKWECPQVRADSVGSWTLDSKPQALHSGSDFLLSPGPYDVCRWAPAPLIPMPGTHQTSPNHVDCLSPPSLECIQEAKHWVGLESARIPGQQLHGGQRRQWTCHSGVPLGGFEGWAGMREGPGSGVKQQPQRLFLFIGITRFLGQVPTPGKGGQAGLEGSGGRRRVRSPGPPPTSVLWLHSKSSHPCSRAPL